MSATDANSSSPSDWKHLRSELCRRTWQPFSSAPFVIYVLLAIVGLGCLGIWVELVKLARVDGDGSSDGVLTALATFYPALVGSASLQLILYSTGRGDKTLTSFALLACIASLASVVLISVFHTQFPILTVRAAIFFVLFSIWLWWITNADDPTYKSAPIDAASGGDPDRPLAGSTKGFKK